MVRISVAHELNNIFRGVISGDDDCYRGNQKHASEGGSPPPQTAFAHSKSVFARPVPARYGFASYVQLQI